MKDFFRKKDSSGYITPRYGRIALAVILPILFLIGFFGSFSFVGAGHVGVVTRFSAVNRVVEPGLVLKLPLIESVHKMETRTQKEQVDAQAASKDLQEVKSTIALNYHLNGPKAVDVFQNVGEDYVGRIVAPAMQEAFKATTAKFTAQDLIEKRESVKVLAYAELTKRLEKYNVIVDDFNIVNFDFSAEFNGAIEAKTVAQQNLERAKLEAATAVTKAQGQADAQKRLKDSGSLSPEYLQFLALQSWDGKLPAVVGNGTPFINIPLR
jgi:regulator of protease activity HflC (stomatin/prohibitin superfamily)